MMTMKSFTAVAQTPKSSRLPIGGSQSENGQTIQGVNRLNVLLDTLGDVMDKLESCLSPVLHNAPPQDASPKGVQSLPELPAEINDICLRVEIATDFIRSIIDRLEL